MLDAELKDFGVQLAMLGGHSLVRPPAKNPVKSGVT
jgi:hypothetical protein